MLLTHGYLLSYFAPTWLINLWLDSYKQPSPGNRPVRSRLGLGQPQCRLGFNFYLSFYLFVCLFFLFCLCLFVIWISTNNSVNPNMNPYFISTSFDSNNSYPVLNNMNQPNNLDLIYSTQYNPYHLSDDQHFQNNFNSSQSRRGFISPGLIFSHIVHNFTIFTIFIPRFCFLYSFSRTTH